VPSIDLLGYPILVESGALTRIGALVRECASAHRYAVITDDNVASRYLAPIRDALIADAASAVSSEHVQTVVIPPGESQKTREQWAGITDALLAAGCGRDTAIIALGGGVIGDLAGFVAATYMRGISVVQVPTTLLAMVDASVGGKTAVDTPAGKNTVGAFHPPALVVIDPSTLATLPPRELRAGFAEVIKHGVIASADEIDAVMTVAPRVLDAVEVPTVLEPLIERSVRIKANVVAADEREHGLRKVLNFGHTIGHGVEAASDYALRHGEAIAIGMVAEAQIAERARIAEPGTGNAIERALHGVGLPTRIPPAISVGRILAAMRSDKKQRSGALEYALPKRIGAMAGESTGWGIPIDDALTKSVLLGLR